MDLAEVNQGVRGSPDDELWIGHLRAVDGYVEPSDAPGFGVKPNDAML